MKRLRVGRRYAAVAAAMVASLLATQALADTPPSSWDVARDPAVKERWMLHERVQRLLLAAEGARDSQVQLRLLAARAMLEDADAAHSEDVRLRFDLGEVYVKLELRTQAVAVLAPALDAAPDHPGAPQALEALAYAYAKLDKPTEELATWRRYIPLLTNDMVRVQQMMNMGEAEMRLGLIEEALHTFEEVLRLCGVLPNTQGINFTYVLTLWDMAVALDRSGDSRGALQMAARALGQKDGKHHIEKDEDRVFFVPDWERDWYLALAAEAEARQAPDLRARAAALSEAENYLEDYVSRAAVDRRKDPWLPLARLRLAQARARRRKAEQRAAALPPARGTAPRGGAVEWHLD